MSALRPYEKWKPVVSLENLGLKKSYAVTNMGRVISYTDNIENGAEVGSLTEGYLCVKLKPHGGTTNKSILIHKLVAEYYLDPPTSDQKFLIHKDHNKLNNYPHNLKWVTKEEWWVHWKKSPIVKASQKEFLERNKINQPNTKLTTTDVIRIKRILKDPSRKNSIARIAKMFGVHEMQIYRIQRGENWSHVIV